MTLTQQKTHHKHRIFNRADRFAQGWYWALRSGDLKADAHRSLTLLGREIVLQRDRTNIPSATSTSDPEQSWPTAERYGLIWLWIGQTDHPTQPLPQVPELGEQPCDAIVSDSFNRKCHPNVLLINAIDAHHFNSVHNLPLEIRFETKALSNAALQFNNITRGGEASRFVRLIRPLYKNEVTYRLCYWYGNTGTVTLGPDFL
ncbi:MAG: aromatic ring-hydroxylating dioxygenase subunit alpha, partial [Cyanobacteria bacterium J06643_4]